MKSHNRCDRGGAVKKIFFIMTAVCFCIFAGVLVYAILLIINDSNISPDPPKIIKRSVDEANTAAKIIDLIGLYKNSNRYFIKDEKLKKYFDLKDIESNLSTIENSLLSYLDVDSNSTLSAFLLQNRILFSEKFSYFAECETACALSAYANYKIEKGDNARALSAVNSLLSLSLIAQKGNNGEKNISEGFFIAADIKEMAYRSALKLMNSKTPLSREQFAELASKLEKYSLLYDDIFSLGEEEKLFAKKSIKEQFAELKSEGKVWWVGTNLEFDLMNLYYGDAGKQREKFFDDMIACKNLSYKEMKLKLDHFFKLQVATHISVKAVITSDINPVALACTCQNLKFLIQKHVISKLVVNAVVLRAAIQKQNRAGAKAPSNIDELSKLDCLKKFPGICTDIFAGTPLKYSVGTTGEVNIYSVGPDMTDDGGKFRSICDDDMYGFDSPGFPLKGYDLKL